MSKYRAWLTPDSEPDGVVCRLVWLPNGEGFESAARGALAPLMVADNWEQVGSITPEETAAYFQDAFQETMQWAECEGVMQFIHAVDDKTPGTHGGSYDTADDEILRDLNTLLHDGTDEAYVSSNRLGIPAGKYTVVAQVPYVAVGPVAIRLRVVGQEEEDFVPFYVEGMNDRAVITGGSGHAHIRGYFEVPDPAEIRVYFEANASREDYGLGFANNFLAQERYTSLELWRWLVGSP